MSTVKITDLSSITVSPNTANSVLVGVDLPTDVTGKMTVKALSEGIYRNNPLNVGTSVITLPNTIGQFASSSNNYIQVNLMNRDEEGTADYVVTANAGGDTYYYIDMGYTNINYNPLNANNSLGTSAHPLDGYLYVQGDGPGTLGGNLIIGTSTPDREVVVISGGVNFDNIAAKFTSTGLKLHYNKSLIFADDTVQTTAASPVAYSQAAFALANTANAYAYNANTFVQSNYLKKTSDTLTGDLTVTNSISTTNLVVNGTTTSVGTTMMIGNLTSNGTSNLVGNVIMNGTALIEGYFNVNNSTFSANTAMMRMTASDGYAVVSPSNSYYMLHITGKSNNSTRVVLDSFGANTYPLLAGRMGRGSAATPSPTQNNDVMMRVVGNGYLPTSGFKASSPTKIDFVASQDFSEANNGTRIEFWNTPNNSNTIQKVASFNANSVEFTGVVKPEKGFIFTPRVLPGAQTAITIDFSSDSTIKASCNADVTFSLSNYTYGKIVEVWLTNTGAQNRTITHGCSAINSTVNSTTYSIPATSTIMARYMSMDGTLANTLVSVIHA